MRETHRYCDEVADPNKNPDVKQAIYGDCSESQHDSLADKQRQICDKGGERRCKRDDTCDVARAKKKMNVECHDARMEVVNACYKGRPDKGHKEALENATRAIERCDEVITRVCK